MSRRLDIEAYMALERAGIGATWNGYNKTGTRRLTATRIIHGEIKSVSFMIDGGTIDNELFVEYLARNGFDAWGRKL